MTKRITDGKHVEAELLPRMTATQQAIMDEMKRLPEGGRIIISMNRQCGLTDALRMALAKIAGIKEEGP